LFDSRSSTWPKPHPNSHFSLASRRCARKHIKNGAGADGQQADRATVIKLLNEALATELVCLLATEGRTQLHPDGLAMRSHAEYVEGNSYGEMTRYIGAKDHDPPHAGRPCALNGLN
jgi:hypothetical protein